MWRREIEKMKMREELRRLQREYELVVGKITRKLEALIDAPLSHFESENPKIKTVISLLKDVNMENRLHAISLLDDFPYNIQKAILMELLRSDIEPKIRLSAAEAVGDLGDKALIPILRRAMDDDTDPEVRKAAADAIELIESLEEL